MYRISVIKVAKISAEKNVCFDPLQAFDTIASYIHECEGSYPKLS